METCIFLEEHLVYRLLTRGIDLTSLKNVEFIFLRDDLEVDVDQPELTMEELEKNFYSFMVIQDGVEVNRDALDPSKETLAVALHKTDSFFHQVFLVRGM